MINFVMWSKCGDPRVLLELSLFDFVAILNWILSSQLYFHLVIYYALARMVASQLKESETLIFSVIVLIKS